MGQNVETLEDLLRPGLKAVCVGINPAPVSVEAGHYYQGRLGRLFFRRLRSAEVLPPVTQGFEDDIAFAVGIGFTDIVKRPTASAKEIIPAEYAHGRDLLLTKLDAHKPEIVIFSFKKTAEVLFGRFTGNGFVTRLSLAQSDVYVMPGPYQEASTAAATIRQLAKRFRTQ